MGTYGNSTNGINNDSDNKIPTILSEIISKAAEIKEDIDNVKTDLSNPDIDETTRSECMEILNDLEAKYKDFAEQCGEQIKDAFVMACNGDDDKARDIVDYARAQEAGGKDFFEALTEKLYSETVDSDHVTNNQDDNTDKDFSATSGPDADQSSQDTESDNGKDDFRQDTEQDSKDSKEDSQQDTDKQVDNDTTEPKDSPVIDEETYKALYDICGGNENEIKEVYEFLHKEYNGDIDKIHENVNFAKDIDEEKLNMSHEEAIGAKVRYDEAKDQFDATKGKFNFRNTFAVVDRLQFNIEAYKTGLPGANGKPVSGGDIAMNIIELTRTNIFESLLEVGIRAVLDRAFPPKADVDKDENNVDNSDADKEKPADNDSSNPTKENDSFVDENGVHDNGRAESKVDSNAIDKNNPAAGNYCGANMAKDPWERGDMKIHNADPTIEKTVVINGAQENIRIPSMRVVELYGNTYLVDPAGKAIPIEITNDKAALSLDEKGEGYIKSLDISCDKKFSEAISSLADNKGISVEKLKVELSESARDLHVQKAVARVEKHGEFLENDRIPDNKATIEGYREKVDILNGEKAKIEAEIEKITKDYDPNNHNQQDIEKLKSLESRLSETDKYIDKLSAAIEGKEEYVKKLESTVDEYGKFKDVAASNKTDLDTKLKEAIAAERDSSGRSEDLRFGLSKEDSREIADIIEKITAQDEKDDADKDKKDTADENGDDATDKGENPDDTNDSPDNETEKGEKSDDSKDESDNPDIGSDDKKPDDDAADKDNANAENDKVDGDASPASNKTDNPDADVKDIDVSEKHDDSKSNVSKPDIEPNKDSRVEISGDESKKEHNDAKEKPDVESKSTEEDLKRELDAYESIGRDIADDAIDKEIWSDDKIESLSMEIDKYDEQIEIAEGRSDISGEDIQALEEAKSIKEEELAQLKIEREEWQLGDKIDLGQNLATIHEEDNLSLEEKVEKARGLGDELGITREQVEERIEAMHPEDKAEAAVSDERRESQIEGDIKVLDAESQSEPDAVEQQEKDVEQDTSEQVEKPQTPEDEQNIEAQKEDEKKDGVEQNDEAQSDGVDSDEPYPSDIFSAEDSDSTANIESEAKDADVVLADDSDQDTLDVGENGDTDNGLPNTDTLDADAPDAGTPNDDAANIETVNEDVRSGNNAEESVAKGTNDESDIVIASESESTEITKDDIYDALDRFIEQGPEGTYSFEEDFLKEYAGEISQDDLYAAFKEKVDEIKEKAEDGEVDEDTVDKMSDIFDSIYDFSMDTFYDNVEEIYNLVDAICSDDMDTIGNEIIGDWLDRFDAQLEPISEVSTIINEHFGVDGTIDGEAFKDSIVDRLDDIGLNLTDANVDKIVNIAEAMENIFDGFENLLSGIAETFGAHNDIDQVDINAENVDANVADIMQPDAIPGDTFEMPDIEVPDIGADIGGAENIPIDGQDFDVDFDISNFDLSDNVSSFVDAMSGLDSSVDAIGSMVESGADIDAVAAFLA